MAEEATWPQRPEPRVETRDGQKVLVVTREIVRTPADLQRQMRILDEEIAAAQQRYVDPLVQQRQRLAEQLQTLQG